MTVDGRYKPLESLDGKDSPMSKLTKELFMGLNCLRHARHDLLA